MTGKNIIFLILISSILILSGCDSGGSDYVQGQDYVLAGYYMMAGEETEISEGSDRATAPTHWDDYKNYTFNQLIALGSGGTKINNYPERGQRTYITVTVADAAKNIYFISSKTEYPKHDETIDYYLEEYYLKGTGGDQKWSEAPIVDPAGNTDAKYRKTMIVKFQDGSVRSEWIDETHGKDTAGNYAHFDINGDLTIPTDTSWAPPTQATGMDWSSKVYYYQKINQKIGWFTQENKEIFGVRYYTESAGPNPAKPLRTSLAYEQMLSQETINTGFTWIDSIVTWIFGSGDSSDDVTLAETVIRYRIETSGQKTTRSSSRVVPSIGNPITLDNEMSY